MATITETLMSQMSFDIAVSKTEMFDLDMANELVRNDNISKDELSKLRGYIRRRVRGRYNEITYVLGIKSKTSMLGRFVAKGGVGLQMLPHDIRSALAKPYYHDIDMKNAQPTLLLQLAKQKGWEHSALQHYVSKREETLVEVQNELGCNRMEAKGRILQLFFGSSYTDGLPAWITKSLYPELCKMKSNIYAANVDFAKKHKKDANSVMAFILQTIERSCLMSMDKALTLKGRSMDVLIHDGGYVRKLENETEFPQELMRYCEACVLKDTGFEIRLEQKPIETSFDRKEETTQVYPENTIIDDVFAARAFADWMKDDIVLSFGNIYTFDTSTGVWSGDDTALDRKITEAGDVLIFRQQTLIGVKIYNYSGIVKNCENLKRKLITILNRNDTFLIEGRKRSTFKLLFKNGIYDFKTQVFTKSFDRNIVFSHPIDRDFNDDVHQEDVDFVNDTFFVAPFSREETPKVFRHYLMRGLIGDYRMKKFIVALGDKNSSKGTLTNFMEYCIGRNAATFNANVLLLRKMQGDAEREMSWVSQICDSRLAFSNEIKNIDEVKIDGNMLKTLTGGGDPITLRRMYKDPEVVYNMSMPILFAQDLPSITPPDAINSRIIVIQYDYSFMETPNPLRPSEKQGDPTIKDKLCCSKYADAFISLMIQEYNTWADSDFAEMVLPDYMIEDKEELAPTSEVQTIIDEQYVLTGNVDDFVPLADITKFLKERKVTMSSTRLGRELTRLNILRKAKKINRRTIFVCVGIREVNSADE